jgi:hypothetical protein
LALCTAYRNAISNRPPLRYSNEPQEFWMSNTDSISFARANERQTRSAASVAPRLSPFAEKALLFWGFSAAAGCWMAVVWWIVR